MGVRIAALSALFLVVAANASYNQSTVTKQLAVQLDGQSEICAVAARSTPSFLQKKSQTSRRNGVQAGLFLGPGWDPKSPMELHKKYDEIFKTGNRNAASHLWVSYVLDRATGLSHSQIKMLMSSFCAVSGSPVGPGATSRYKAQLDKASGGAAEGFVYHCCWPCVCDTQDFIKVDTKTVTDKAGAEKQYQWLVIGDPCKKNPPRCTEEGEKNCLPFEAPEVVCKGTTLKGAILSDNGHIIIGPLEDDDPSMVEDEDYLDYKGGKSACEERAQAGYQSGMGEIFRQVAQITPF